MYLSLMRLFRILFILVLPACYSPIENENAETPLLPSPNAELFAPENFDIAAIDNTDSIVRYFSDDSIVHDGHVGIGGNQSTTYAHYIRLKELATDSLLEELIQHENPVVRVYAYWALIERTYPKKEALMSISDNDSEPVDFLSGCLGSRQTVAELVQQKWDKHNPKIK